MLLNKYKIGDLVSIVDERNSEGLRNFYGININKEFMPTVANTDNLDEKKYKVVRKNRFVYSGMQTGRDECIRIGLYLENEPIIVSPAYTTFEIVDTNIVLPEYFFMIFLSKEKDRLGWFLSDSSIRSNLDWDRFCKIEFNLPDVKIQRKYVDIYMGLKQNIEAYEGGKDDLKIACDAYIENLRRNMPCQEIRTYIQEVNERNSDLTITNVRGVNSNSQFIPTKAKTDGLDFSKYKIVKQGQFAYNPSRINLGSIALSNEEDCIISPMYVVFKITNTEKLLPEYLMMWLSRSEFYRSTLFFAIGSVRDTFDYNLMEEVKIPIPDIELQRKIVSIFNEYNNRNSIYDELKNIQKTLCPILIKGSVEEAKKCEVASIG